MSEENKIKINEVEYEITQIEEILNEHKELTPLKGKQESIEVGDIVIDALKSNDPINNLQKLVDELKSQAGYVAPDDKPAFELPKLSEYADDDTKALHATLQNLGNVLAANSGSVKEIKALINQLAAETKIDSTATTSADRVSKELSISITPAQVREAIKSTGINDPVKACWTFYMDDIRKGKMQEKSTKPNFVETKTNSKDVDLSKLSPFERFKVLVADPDARRKFNENN